MLSQDVCVKWLVEGTFFFLTKNVYVMLRGGLYNENAVSENMSHSYSNMVKNFGLKAGYYLPFISYQQLSFPFTMKSRLNENGYMSA